MIRGDFVRLSGWHSRLRTRHHAFNGPCRLGSECGPKVERRREAKPAQYALRYEPHLL